MVMPIDSVHGLHSASLKVGLIDISDKCGIDVTSSNASNSIVAEQDSKSIHLITQKIAKNGIDDKKYNSAETGDIADPKSVLIALDTIEHINGHIPKPIDISLKGSISNGIVEGGMPVLIAKTGDIMSIKDSDHIVMHIMDLDIGKIVSEANTTNPKNSYQNDVGKVTIAEHLVISNKDVEAGLIGNQNDVKTEHSNDLVLNGIGIIKEDKIHIHIPNPDTEKAYVADYNDKSKGVQPESQCENGIKTNSAKALDGAPCLVKGMEIAVDDKIAAIDNNGKSQPIGSKEGIHKAKETKVLIGHNSSKDLTMAITLVMHDENIGTSELRKANNVNVQGIIALATIAENNKGAISFEIGGTGIASPIAPGAVTAVSGVIRHAKLNCKLCYVVRDCYRFLAFSICAKGIGVLVPFDWGSFIKETYGQEVVWFCVAVGYCDWIVCFASFDDQ